MRVACQREGERGSRVEHRGVGREVDSPRRLKRLSPGRSRTTNGASARVFLLLRQQPVGRRPRRQRTDRWACWPLVIRPWLCACPRPIPRGLQAAHVWPRRVEPSGRDGVDHHADAFDRQQQDRRAGDERWSARARTTRSPASPGRYSTADDYRAELARRGIDQQAITMLCLTWMIALLTLANVASPRESL